ncbi:MAG: hypothetical protein MZV65_48840 [Chromatiales bacterium]|nr:hypothetical protein [Chromatiales bacterium]
MTAIDPLRMRKATAEDLRSSAKTFWSIYQAVLLDPDISPGRIKFRPVTNLARLRGGILSHIEPAVGVPSDYVRDPSAAGIAFS